MYLSHVTFIVVRPTQGISVTPASSRTPTVLDYCASSLIPELPTKKPSGANLAVLFGSLHEL